VASINGGRGVIANIVAPRSNYPRGVKGSVSPYYAGGTVYHYISVMGYDDAGARSVWIADSGFQPQGYWMAFDQLASLIPPKGYAAAPGPVAPAEKPAAGLSAETLSKAMGGSLPIERYRELLPGFVNAMIAADCKTVERAAMWCAQIGHESSGLRYMEEIASGAAYNGRADLGNTQPGDGPRYKGSGPIQLTGRHNFRKFSEWCHSKGWVDSPRLFEDNPGLVRSDPRWGFLAATWYWTVARPQINELSDRRDLVGVTRAINGGTNGLADRESRYKRCLDLGAALIPSTGGGAPMSAEEVQEIKDFIVAFCGPIGQDAKDVREQLTGGRDAGEFPGWPQLGGRTLVDGHAKALDDHHVLVENQINIMAAVRQIAESKGDE